jgi:two-component system, sensor histidine kinase
MFEIAPWVVTVAVLTAAAVAYVRWGRAANRRGDAESRLSAVLDAAVDGIVVIGERGIVQSYNPAAERIFGYTAPEVVGRNVSMLMPEPYRSAHDGYLEAYKRTGVPRIIGIGREVTGKRKDGSLFPLDLAVGESRVGGRRLFAGIVRDITERKRTEERLRQSEERLRLLVENVKDYALIGLDTEGRIDAWNAGAERLYGWRLDEIVGQAMDGLAGTSARGLAGRVVETVRGTGRFEEEGWHARKDAGRFWAHATVAPLLDPGGTLRGYVLVSRDMTEAKRVEQALRAAKDEAERANIAKSKFLASASHDLRQPVQALVFFASALESRIGQSPAAAVLGDMKGSLEALNALLDALLDVSRLDAGIVVPRATNFSLGVLFDRMAAEFQPLAADKALTLSSVPTSAVVRTDPTLLGRIVQNLVANAIRYTPHGRILIGCRRGKRTVRIEVWDTGIGIPRDRLTDIFQEFVQIENGERDRAKGLGLGLAIVQRISRLLGLTVRVRSEPAKGSVFTVEVPVVGYNRAKAASFLEPPPATRLNAADKGVVLLIDDEVTILKGLQMVIEGWGYEVLAAMGEAEALELLSNLGRAPDIIIADYRLREGRTGAEAIRHIRHRFNRTVPAVIVTGDTAPERLREAEAHGLSLLHKPVQTSVLQTVLSEHVHG